MLRSFNIYQLVYNLICTSRITEEICTYVLWSDVLLSAYNNNNDDDDDDDTNNNGNTFTVCLNQRIYSSVYIKQYVVKGAHQ